MCIITNSKKKVVYNKRMPTKKNLILNMNLKELRMLCDKFNIRKGLKQNMIDQLLCIQGRIPKSEIFKHVQTGGRDGTLKQFDQSYLITQYTKSHLATQSKKSHLATQSKKSESQSRSQHLQSQIQRLYDILFNIQTVNTNIQLYNRNMVINVHKKQQRNIDLIKSINQSNQSINTEISNIYLDDDMIQALAIKCGLWYDFLITSNQVQTSSNSKKTTNNQHGGTFQNKLQALKIVLLGMIKPIFKSNIVHVYEDDEDDEDVDEWRKENNIQPVIRNNFFTKSISSSNRKTTIPKTNHSIKGTKQFITVAEKNPQFYNYEKVRDFGLNNWKINQLWGEFFLNDADILPYERNAKVLKENIMVFDEHPFKHFVVKRTNSKTIQVSLIQEQERSNFFQLEWWEGEQLKYAMIQLPTCEDITKVFNKFITDNNIKDVNDNVILHFQNFLIHNPVQLILNDLTKLTSTFEELYKTNMDVVPFRQGSHAICWLCSILNACFFIQKDALAKKKITITIRKNDIDVVDVLDVVEVKFKDSYQSILEKAMQTLNPLEFVSKLRIDKIALNPSDTGYHVDVAKMEKFLARGNYPDSIFEGLSMNYDVISAADYGYWDNLGLAERSSDRSYSLLLIAVQHVGFRYKDNEKEFVFDSRYNHSYTINEYYEHQGEIATNANEFGNDIMKAVKNNIIIMPIIPLRPEIVWYTGMIPTNVITNVIHPISYDSKLTKHMRHYFKKEMYPKKRTGLYDVIHVNNSTYYNPLHVPPKSKIEETEHELKNPDNYIRTRHYKSIEIRSHDLRFYQDPGSKY